jgi:hypothetical protein
MTSTPTSLPICKARRASLATRIAMPQSPASIAKRAGGGV